MTNELLSREIKPPAMLPWSYEEAGELVFISDLNNSRRTRIMEMEKSCFRAPSTWLSTGSRFSLITMYMHGFASLVSSYFREITGNDCSSALTHFEDEHQAVIAEKKYSVITDACMTVRYKRPDIKIHSNRIVVGIRNWPSYWANIILNISREDKRGIKWRRDSMREIVCEENSWNWISLAAAVGVNTYLPKRGRRYEYENSPSTGSAEVTYSHHIVYISYTIPWRSWVSINHPLRIIRIHLRWLKAAGKCRCKYCWRMETVVDKMGCN